MMSATRRCLVPLALLVPLATSASSTVPVQEVTVAPEQHIRYEGVFWGSFPGGLTPAAGFGLAVIGRDPNGALRLLTATGGGPTAAAPEIEDREARTHPARAFLVPTFTPSVATLALRPHQLSVEGWLPLLNAEGRPLTGLPPRVRNKDPRPLSDKLTPVEPDPFGIDPRAVALDATGRLWVAEEHAPALLQFNRETGRLLARYAPGNGLPEILAKRRPGRGFSGIAVTPSGKIVAILQGILDVQGRYGDSRAALIRIVELDPASGRVRMLAYPPDLEAYSAARDARVGALLALSDAQLLLVESGRDRKKRRHAILYRVDLAGATDLTGVVASKNRSLETLGSASDVEKRGVRFVRKWRLLDLVASGWPRRSVDGIALIDDGRTLVVSAAADGLAAEIERPARRGRSGKPARDPEDSVLDHKGRLTRRGQPTRAKWVIRPTGQASVVGLIPMPEPIRATR